MDRRVTVCGEVNLLRRVAVAKASLNRANEGPQFAIYRKMGTQSQVVDPKPSDLPMARLKGM